MIKRFFDKIETNVTLVEDLSRHTHVKEVSLHATAVTLFVPVRPLTAAVKQVTRQSTVVAVSVGTVTAHMSWSSTQVAGRQPLHMDKNIYTFFFNCYCLNHCILAIFKYCC